MRRVSPVHGQTDAGGLGAHPLQQASEIPWDPQLAREMHVTPICPSQKPHLLPLSPQDSLAEATWMVNPVQLAECVIPHTRREQNLLAMSINTLSQRYATDGPSSAPAKGRR